MASRKLLRVERTINTYSNNENKLLGGINIDVIHFDELKGIVLPKDDDPLLYDGYVLDIKQLEQLNRHLPNQISFDFDLYYYVLECYGIYEE